MKLTNRSKVVSDKKMTFGESIYIPAILKGMKITMSHAVKTVFGKGLATISYPEEVRPRVKIWRGEHVLKDVQLADFVRLLVLQKPSQ